MKAIQKELGDDEGRDELADLEEKIAKTKLSKEAREKAQHELKKLRQMSPMSAEATVVRNYLDWLLSIPWGKKSKVKKDLVAAQEVLDSDHYGLEKVKDRIHMLQTHGTPFRLHTWLQTSVSCPAAAVCLLVYFFKMLFLLFHFLVKIIHTAYHTRSRHKAVVGNSFHFKDALPASRARIMILRITSVPLRSRRGSGSVYPSSCACFHHLGKTCGCHHNY